MTNNTIANNRAVRGGGINCNLASSPTMRNTILWGNTAENGGPQVYIDDEGSDPNFYYCDVQGGTGAFAVNFTIYTGTYQNNLDSDPLLVAPSAGSGTGYNGVVADWTLQTFSPCINAGDPAGTYPATDKAGNPRVVSGIIDIGAFEYQWPAAIYSAGNREALRIYPNPAADFLIIENPRNASIELLTIDGKCIQKTTNDYAAETTIHLGNLPGGVYLIKATKNDAVTIQKFIKH
jgi:hypothetical protein